MLARLRIGFIVALSAAIVLTMELIYPMVRERPPVRCFGGERCGATWTAGKETLPRITGFDSESERRLAHAQSVDLEFKRLPRKWRRNKNDVAARITFRAAEYPGLALRDVPQDWSGYDTLTFMVYSELARPIELYLRVDDTRHSDLLTDRFDHRLAIQPGPNQILIPLEQLGLRHEGRDLDTTRMCHMILFARRPAAPFTVYVDRFQLERSKQ